MFCLPVNISVGYDPTMYVTTEGQGMVDLRIVIFDPPAGGTPRPFTLLVSTMDGTAGMCMAFIQLSAIIQFFSSCK